MLDAARAGDHALLVAATGAGKTLAGFLPTLADLIEHPRDGLHTLYVSPLKALAVDVQRNLMAPIEEMGLAIRVETRSGDTPSDRKARQRIRPPHILLTTPESLSLLLSYPDSALLFDRSQDRRHRRNPRLRPRKARRSAQPRRSPGSSISPPTSAASASAPPSAIPTPIAPGSPPTATSTRCGWSMATPAPSPTCRSSSPRAACPGRAIRGAMPPNR